MRIVLLIIVLLISQLTKSQENILSYKFDDLGIFVEVFDSLNNDENRYNFDNAIYKVSKKFYFDYYYLDTNGIKYLMAQDTSADWKLVKSSDINPNSINEIIMTIESGLSPFIQYVKDYNQTVLKYDFRMNNDKFLSYEMTGVIENIKNIWLHPPRNYLFQILELNPFPYIKSPFQVGNQWDWELKIPEGWSDKRWAEWEGNLINKCKYQITDFVNLKTQIGSLKCFVIKSIATNRIGTTELVSYFNEQYGFVKLEYTNIDKSQIIIEIKKIPAMLYSIRMHKPF